MRVKLTKKLNGTLGLVQEQKATIVAFVFHEQDALRYSSARPGELFRPCYLPAGIWLQVDDFDANPLHEDVWDLVAKDGEVDDSDHEKRARGLFYLPAMEDTFTWCSHTVKRIGFCLTSEYYLTSTSAQGHTIRTGLTVDCARIPPQGNRGLHEDKWWFHLYVMFSRATRMSDMLLLRPPPRALLAKVPPPTIAEALEQFERKIERSTQEAVTLATAFGFPLP
jgi:hypothetical protein